MLSSVASPRVPTPAKKPRAKRGRATFRSRSLEQAFLAFLQDELPCTPWEPLEQRWQLALREKIDWIDNAEFAAEDAEKTVLQTELLGTGLPTPPRVRDAKLSDLPSHLARLCEARLLTPPEEQALFQRMNFLRHLASRHQAAMREMAPDEWAWLRLQGLLRAANWYRDLLVRSNMRLVISIVKKFVNANNGFDDLLSDGIVALMRAVDKFDYGRGFRFSTYATQVVRRNAYRTVMQRQKDRWQNSTSLQEAGLDISDDRPESAISLDRWHELRAKLGMMLDHLDRREKLIVRARFSLGSHRQVQTLQRLADKLNVSKERIRQLEKRALEKLRAMVGDFPLPETED